MSKIITFFNFTYFLIVIMITWKLNLFISSTLYFVCDFVARTLMACIVAFYTLPIVQKFVFRRKISSQNKAVLITGCDYGIGHVLAKRLDSKGFKVFASCLFPKGYGAKMLKESCSNNLHVLRLDITKDVSVRKGVHYVKENLNGSELWAIVNNTGVRALKVFDVELMQIADYQEIMDFYTMAVVRVTKAFLPLLRSSKGRAVIITSIAGRISIPSFSAYCMSKFAVSCFCNCLRQELLSSEVKVIAVEPNFFRTRFEDWSVTNLKLNNSWINLDETEKVTNYLNEYKKARQRSLQNSSNRYHKVIDSLENSVTLEEPCAVYRPSQNILMQLIFNVEDVLPKYVVHLLWCIVDYSVGLSFPRQTKQYFPTDSSSASNKVNP